MPRLGGLSKRRPSDFLLFGVTATELAILVFLTRTFTVTDWIYVSQHLIVLAIAMTRAPSYARDGSLATGIARGTTSSTGATASTAASASAPTPITGVPAGRIAATWTAIWRRPDEATTPWSGSTPGTLSGGLRRRW